MQPRILTLLAVFALCAPAPAAAIPALQLGPGSGDWSYDTSSQTWVSPDNPLNLIATANSGSVGSGAYAWDTGAATQTAYLVVAAGSPVAGGFSVNVMNDGAPLMLSESGFGNPPLGDPNSLASHGIYDTYFEVYAFEFDGPVTTITNTQPGSTGTGAGFLEEFVISYRLADGVDDIHFDLFTVSGGGLLENAVLGDKKMVRSFAPFSHDAGTTTTVVPEPGAALLTAIALLAVHVRAKQRA